MLDARFWILDSGCWHLASSIKKPPPIKARINK